MKTVKQLVFDEKNRVVAELVTAQAKLLDVKNAGIAAQAVVDSLKEARDIYNDWLAANP